MNIRIFWSSLIKYCKRTLLLIFILGCHWVSIAQIPGLKKYTQIDGFTATNGYRITQDSIGQICIGTDNGGMRFDGKRFTFLSDSSNGSDAEIFLCFPLDKDLLLLVPMLNHLRYIDHGVTTNTNLNNIHNRYQNLFKEDYTAQALWLTDKGKFKTVYRFSKHDIKRVDLSDSKWGDGISDIVNDIIYGYDSGNYLSTYDIDKKEVHNFHYESGAKAKIFKEFFIIVVPAIQGYLLTSSNGKNVNVYRYSNDEMILHLAGQINIPESMPPLASGMTDKNRDLWLKFVGKGGIAYYGNIAHINSDDPFYLTVDGIINSCFVDANNNIWLSSQNNALYFLSANHFRNALMTRHFILKDEIPQSISGDGNGALYIGYAGSSKILCINGKERKIINLKNELSEGSKNIFPIGDKRYIIYNKDIACFDMNDYSVKYLMNNLGYCKDGCLYDNEHLLFATSDDVIYTSLPFNKESSRAKKIFNGRSTSVEVLTNKQILIGTPYGLYVKDNLDANAVLVSNDVLKESNITDIQALPNGSAIIASNGQGIFLYSSVNDTKVIDDDLPVALKKVKRIYKQNDSIYWFATDQGAYSITLDKYYHISRLSNYTFYDGLPSNNVSSIYVCRDTAFFTTTEGLGMISLNDSVNLQMKPPGISINSIQIGNDIIRYPDSSIVVPYYKNNISISVSANSFESIGNLKFYYQLSPYQDEWLTSTEPTLTMAKIPPGKYVLTVYAINAKGIKSIYPIKLKITIKPAMWQTWYFKASVFILLCTVVFFVMRWVTYRMGKSKLEKIQQKKHLAELELEAIKAQINPHFIYNCLNSIQYLNYKEEYLQSQQYLDIFARLIRLTMKYSQQKFISVAEEVEYLSYYLQLEKLRFKEKLNYHLDIPGDLDKSTQIPAMLIQPYVENALKHGIINRKGDGHVWVMFSKHGNELHIIVKDDGPGFSDVENDGTLGLRISKTRAMSYNQLFNLDIQISFYNEQDIYKDRTGAVVKISINPKN
jgi:hypothetical protein